MDRSRPGVWFYIAILLLGPVSHLIHELAHWGAGEIIGIDMWMSLNKAGPVEGVYGSDLNRIIIALAGPLATLAIGVIAYLIAVSTKSFIAYGVLFVQFMMRLVPSGFTLGGIHPNDEAVAGELLGIGQIPLTVAFPLVLFLLTWDAARRLRPGWMHNVGAWITTSVFFTALVMSDQWLRDLDFRLLG